MVCCVKKFSLTPVESCGATMAEADQILRVMVTLMEADDFANNADLPKWKQECIKNYVECTAGFWLGSCYDCIRRCEG